eukprot:gene6712-8321_t
MSTLSGSTESCAVCDLPVRSNRIRAKGRLFHEECFVCSNCKLSLDSFFYKDGKLYCDPCETNLFAKKCDKCSLPIQSTIVNARGKIFHTECFICQQCSNIIKGGFFYINGEFICDKCDENPPPPSSNNNSSVKPPDITPLSISSNNIPPSYNYQPQTPTTPTHNHCNNNHLPLSPTNQSSTATTPSPSPSTLSSSNDYHLQRSQSTLQVQTSPLLLNQNGNSIIQPQTPTTPTSNIIINSSNSSQPATQSTSILVSPLGNSSDGTNNNNNNITTIVDGQTLSKSSTIILPQPPLGGSTNIIYVVNTNQARLSNETMRQLSHGDLSSIFNNSNGGGHDIPQASPTKKSNSGDYKHEKFIPKINGKTLPELLKHSNFEDILSNILKNKIKVHQDIKKEDVEFGKLISSGASGKVYAGIWKGQEVAIKVYSSENICFNREEFDREVSIMSLLDHECFTQFYGANTENNKYLFHVSELVKGGSLRDVLLNKDIRLTYHQQLSIAVDISYAMKYLHSIGVIHRDLKSGNVLITDDMRAKVIDFGTSREIDYSKQMTLNLGTSSWMAPEHFKNEPYTESCDVYSFAIVMWEIYCRKDPYDGVNSWSIPVMVTKGERPPIPSECPVDLSKLIKACWQDKPAKRPKFKEIHAVLVKMLNNLTIGLNLITLKKIDLADQYANNQGYCMTSYYGVFEDPVAGNTDFRIVPGSSTELSIGTFEYVVEFSKMVFSFRFAPNIGENKQLQLGFKRDSDPTISIVNITTYSCLAIPNDITVDFDPSKIRIDYIETLYLPMWRAQFIVNGLIRSVVAQSFSCRSSSAFDCSITNSILPVPHGGNPNNFHLVLTLKSLATLTNEPNPLNITIGGTSFIFSFNLFPTSTESIVQPSSVGFWPKNATTLVSIPNTQLSVGGVTQFQVLNPQLRTLAPIMFKMATQPELQTSFTRTFPVSGTPQNATYVGLNNIFPPDSTVKCEMYDLADVSHTPIGQSATYINQIIDYERFDSTLNNSIIIMNDVGIPAGTELLSIDFYTKFMEEGTPFSYSLLSREQLQIYPFGIAQGDAIVHKLLVSYTINRYLTYNSFITVRYGPSAITVTKQGGTVGDKEAPIVQDLKITQLYGNTYLLQVRVTDNLSGVYCITYMELSNTMYSDSLVSGSLTDGVFESILDLTFTNEEYYPKVTVTDLVGNSRTTRFKLNSNLDPYQLPIFMENILNTNANITKLNMINYFRFEKTTVDVSLEGVWNRLYINFTLEKLEVPMLYIFTAPFVTKENIFKKTIGVWDESLKMFVIDFYIPPKLFTGELIYCIQYDFYYLQDSHLSHLTGFETKIKIISNDTDLLPPIVTDMTIIGGANQFTISSPDDTIGWFITIEDKSGLKSAYFEVKSDYDREPYIFKFTPANAVQGDQFKGVYEIKIPLNTTCRNQQFWLAKTVLMDILGHENQKPDPLLLSYDPLGRINDHFQTLMINVTCPGQVEDTDYPTLVHFDFNPKQIDVTAAFGYQRTVNFTLIVKDTTSGVSRRKEHAPYIYFHSTGTIVLSTKTIRIESANNNFTHVEYGCSFEIPYGKGIDQSFIISVYGLLDNSLNINGYNALRMSEAGFPYIISTTSSLNPIIEKSTSIKENESKLTIYGKALGIDRGVSSIWIDYKKDSGPGFQKIEFKEKDFFCSLMIITDSITPTSTPFDLKIINDGKESNIITIKPILNPTPTPSPTPLPTLPPPQCDNNCGAPNNGESYLGITLPHHNDHITLDPDFSLLLDYNSAKDKDSANCGKSGGLTKSQIAGIVIGSFCAVVIIGICLSYYYYKKRQAARVSKNLQVKLSSMNKQL